MFPLGLRLPVLTFGREIDTGTHREYTLVHHLVFGSRHMVYYQFYHFIF